MIQIGLLMVNEINEWDFQGNDGCYHKKGQICNKGLIN